MEFGTTDSKDTLSFETGVWKLDDFLEYFFIRKCMWENDMILKSDFEYLSETIKERMNWA